MLGLAAPVWLAALAALSVPIALHLWTRRPGRLVRVGSTRHLGGPAPAARRLRLDDPWLLLLRAAVLVALVLALARPYLARDGQREPETWALVERSAAGDAVVDSLRLAGAAVRLLEPGLLPLADASDPSASEATGTPPAEVWSLLREADHLAPPGTRLVVVARPRLTAAAGERPRIYSEVEWIVPRAVARIDPLPRAQVPAEVQAPAADAPRSVTRSATILAGRSRQNDARYVAAALQVVAAGTGESIRLLPADSAAGAAGSAAPGDWLVWLADTTVPSELIAAAEAGAVVLADSPGDSKVAARVLVIERMPGTVVRHAALPDSTTTQPERVSVALWEDGAGRPLLVARRTGLGVRLDHAGRFGTGSLALDPAFPELVARLWKPDALAPATLTATVAQVLPRAVERSTAAALRSRQAAALQLDGTMLLWIIAALLLVGERVVTARRTARRSTA